MPKYEITVKNIEIYGFEIEAEDKTDAYNIAMAIMDSDDAENHHYDSDRETDIDEI